MTLASARKRGEQGRAGTAWTRTADFRAQVQKLWDRGILLASLVSGETLFPRRLILKIPSSSELADRFDEVRAWIADLRQSRHCRVEMREVRHRILGTNLVPDEVWVDTFDDALALIGKSREAKRFAELVEMARARQPLTLPWMARFPLKALELTAEWSCLLDVVGWMQAHPRPGIYLRQIDLPGIHTKFIEGHRAVLGELLNLALPSETIDFDAAGVGQFCRRYGFKDKPLRIRFRILDPSLALLATGTDQEISISHDAFARLETRAQRVFITENEINFLAFPAVPGSLVIFGAGYGWDALAWAEWLHRCVIHYWGDIDTHGFAILDQLRVIFPHARSFLMDRATLMAHESQWGVEAKPQSQPLSRLVDFERSLFEDLRNGRPRLGIRLEQERISFDWLAARLGALYADSEG